MRAIPACELPLASLASHGTAGDSHGSEHDIPLPEPER